MNGNQSGSLRAAIYARVSSDRQVDEQTIESQVADLRRRIAEDELILADELCFLDDGFSGTTLRRPQLERLRDLAYAGGFERLYVHCPDRLARRYAYQVLLIEELIKSGIEIVFLNHPHGSSPEENLLLQMQGIFAEYERGKILERSRRGMRHAARRGSVNVLTKAPYGYEYIPKAETGGEASYVINKEQAAVVRLIFQWVGQERLSLKSVCRRLASQACRNASDNTAWSPSSVRNILKNPAYKGTAVFGKTRRGERRPRLRPLRGKSEIPRRNDSVYQVPEDQHIIIPVPEIVSESMFADAQQQLMNNKSRRPKRVADEDFLLRGLITCGCCGYACYGKRNYQTKKDKTKSVYRYYKCTGSDASRHGGVKICDMKSAVADRLDEAVWQDACELLRHPELLRREYQRRLADSGNAVPHRHLTRQVKNAKDAVDRLLDAYASGLMARDEVEPRLSCARERLRELEAQLVDAEARSQERSMLEHAMASLEDFTAQIGGSLEQANWQTRQQILHTLIERVQLEGEHVRVVYRIDFPLFAGRASREKILQYRLSPLCVQKRPAI